MIKRFDRKTLKALQIEQEANVKLKKYLLGFLFASVPFSALANACYYPNKNSEGTISLIDDCGTLTDPYELSFLSDHIDNIQFDEDELACFAVSDSSGAFAGKELVFWVHRSGKHIRTLYFEMGCQYFHEGLSVGVVDDKKVYIDKALNVVLEPGFDYLENFRDGLAKVCNGPFTYEDQGEHTSMKGGKCGIINRNGDLVLEAEHPIDAHDIFDEFRRSYAQ